METKQKIVFAQGFTLIELLVVISMWMIIATIVLINYTGQRVPRDMKIGGNELVTNIRKIQSYALSARNTPSGNPARYFFAEFNKGAGSYSIYAVDNQSTAAQPLQTVFLPSVAKIAGLFVQQPVGSNAARPNCVQVAFSLPYGKAYVDATCSLRTAQTILADPVLLAAASDSTLTIWLNQASMSTVNQIPTDKFVNISGISGSVLGYDVPPAVPGVCFNQPNQNC